MFAEDLAGYFSLTDFAVNCTFGSETKPVLFDAPGESVLDQASADYQITYKATDFVSPPLTHNSTVTIDGANYSVRAILSVDDGKLKRATLSKAP